MKQTKNLKSSEHITCGLELKSLDEKGYFSGYASVFNTIDKQNDIILNGAFKTSLDKIKKIKLLWQHRADEPIGIFTKVKEDERGLFVEGKLLLNVARAKEAYSLLKEGAVDGMSIGYKVSESNIDENSGTRIIKNLELYEISLVTFPANSEATITSVKNSYEIDKGELFIFSVNLDKALNILNRVP